MAARNLRPIRIEGNIAYIPLTRGYEAVIDAADAHLVDRSNWHAMTDTRNAIYAATKEDRDGKWRNVLLHRLLLGVKDPKVHIDHIDSDGLNNRRSNLRLATRVENMRNQRGHRDSSSGLKGVSWDKRKRKWVAQICVLGQQKFLGRFDTTQEAHEAYCKGAAMFHGEFARVE